MRLFDFGLLARNLKLRQHRLHLLHHRGHLLLCRIRRRSQSLKHLVLFTERAIADKQLEHLGLDIVRRGGEHLRQLAKLFGLDRRGIHALIDQNINVQLGHVVFNRHHHLRARVLRHHLQLLLHFGRGFVGIILRHAHLLRDLLNCRHGAIEAHETHVLFVVRNSDPTLTRPELANTRPHRTVNFKRQAADCVEIVSGFRHSAHLLQRNRLTRLPARILARHRTVRADAVNMLPRVLHQVQVAHQHVGSVENLNVALLADKHAIGPRQFLAHLVRAHARGRRYPKLPRVGRVQRL